MSRNILNSIITVALVFIAVPATAQLTVTTNTNPTQLAQKILGKGITVLNAQFKGTSFSAGTFKAVPGSFLIDSGIVLTSGAAKTEAGRQGVNNPASQQAAVGAGAETNFNDVDLYNYANPSGTTYSTNNACVLEFDFIPQGDSIYIRYIFGSEEYPEYACTQFNDVFAFFINGPGYLQKKNIATVPGAPIVTPVTINTVNSGIPGSSGGNITNCQQYPGAPFPQFYVNNSVSQHVVYDGHTVIMTAKAKVTPCMTYHIKIGVADISDQSHDSGVFIEANSFSSKKEINTEVDGPYLDSLNNNSVTMIEACKTAQVKLKRAPDIVGPFSLTRTFAGTATYNVDYTTDMPATVSFLANENEKIYNFTAPADAFNEGLEKIIVRFSKGTCTTVFVDSAILFIRDSLIYRSSKDTSFCTADPITISGQNPVTAVTNSWLWNTGNTTQAITASQPGTYIVQHVYSERCLNIDTFRLISNDPTWTFSSDTVFICPGDTATLSVTTNANNITWNTGATTSTIKVTTAGEYWVQGINDKNCTRRDTVVVAYKANPSVSLGADTGMCQNSTLQLDATYPGATYQWSNGATTPTITVSTAGQYSVINTLNGCIAKDTINIAVAPIPAVNLGSDVSVCEGNTVQLNAAFTGATHSWSTGATTPTITVTTTGTYSVINSMNGCTAKDTINVEIKPKPALELGADKSVCEGETAEFDATFPGATYQWSNGATTGVINVSTAGKYVVTSTLNGCTATDSASLAVKPIPVVNLGGDTSICANQTITLNAAYTGAAHTWSNGATTPSITVATAGQYFVENSLNGCIDRDTINVNTIPVPVVELGADRSVCEGETVQLDATFPGASYQWSNGATTSTITVSTGGKYVVTSSINNCSAKDSVNVTIKPIPAVNFGSDTSICGNASIVLNASFPGGTTHTWSTGATTPTITVTTTGQYFVENSLNGCVDRDTINITTTPYPLLELGADRSMCQGESVQLDATYPGATYQWSNGATTATISVSAGGKYIVTSSMNNCKSVDSVNVVVKPIPVANFGGDTSICENTSIVLDASFPGGTTHSWSNGATTPTITVNAAGQYHVLNSLNGCTARDTINVATKSAPLLDLGADTSICAYDQVILDASYPGATYLWNNGDDSSSIIVTTAGKYSVISTLSGCPAYDTITISSKKMPVVNAGLDIVVPQNTTAQLNATHHPNNATYLWSPAGTLSNPAIPNPIATPVAPVNEYTLHVVSVDGCENEDKITIRVVYPIRIPNAFSPNGDGINDTWVIKNIELYPKSRVYIFNRYGQQIYNQGGFAGPWDGSYKGKTLEPATYYYIIDVGDGQRHTGYLVLLR